MHKLRRNDKGVYNDEFLGVRGCGVFWSECGCVASVFLGFQVLEIPRLRKSEMGMFRGGHAMVYLGSLFCDGLLGVLHILRYVCFETLLPRYVSCPMQTLFIFHQRIMQSALFFFGLFTNVTTQPIILCTPAILPPLTHPRPKRKIPHRWTLHLCAHPTLNHGGLRDATQRPVSLTAREPIWRKMKLQMQAPLAWIRSPRPCLS